MDSVLFKTLSEVQRGTLTYLWEGLIPIGKLTSVEGDPGLGKSSVVLAVAAAVSRGLLLPGATRAVEGDILLFMAEDDVAFTIKSRLALAGADEVRIKAYEGQLGFDVDGLALIDRALEKYKSKLVIFDPLVAYLGAKVDMHRANQVRHALAGLSRLAEKHDAAIVMVRHLAKGVRDKAIYRGIGSIDITAACRSVLLVGCDPVETDLRAVVQIKNNLGPLAQAQGFRFVNGQFEWTGPSKLTAQRILMPEPESESASAVDEAAQFLQFFLAAGPQSASEVFKAAGEAKISNAAVRRAKDALRVRSQRCSTAGTVGGGSWAWELPKQLDQGGQGEQDV